MSADATTLLLTAQIVSAYAENSSLRPGALVDLIADVGKAIATLSQDQPDAQPKAAPVPAVPVKQSITADYLVSLEDGRQFKALKRHLGTLGMTPDDYRRKWSLPVDYPMVAPNYAARRSELARTLGLGRKRVSERPAPTPAAEPATPKRRGRPRKNPPTE
jgi:predicted transcriptional regulator